MTIGKRLKELRISKGLTQKELAEQLNIPHQNISNYERDFRQPDYETLIKLADFFEEPLDYFIRGKQHLTQTNNGEDFFEFITRLYMEHGINDRGIVDAEEWKKLSKEDLVDLAKYFEWLGFRGEKGQ